MRQRNNEREERSRGTVSHREVVRELEATGERERGTE